MTPSLMTRARPAPAKRSTKIVVSAFGVIALLGLFVGLSRLVEGPDFVDRIKVDNPTPFELDTTITSGTHDGWTAIAPSEARTTTTVDDVVDQGSTWIFRFSRAGVNAGEVRVSRSDLERSGWTVRIPERLGDTLLNAGEQPLPR